MVVSSVSPERWLTTRQLALRASVDGVERLGQRADLVELDEDRIGGILIDPPRAMNAGVGHEDIVADSWTLAPTGR